MKTQRLGWMMALGIGTMGMTMVGGSACDAIDSGDDSVRDTPVEAAGTNDQNDKLGATAGVTADPIDAPTDAAAADAAAADGARQGQVIVAAGAKVLDYGYPASSWTTSHYGIVRWTERSQDGSPDFELIGWYPQNRIGYHAMVWTSSNGRWLNYQNMAAHGVILSLRIIGTPEMVLNPTYAQNPGKWDYENAIHEAADMDRDAYGDSQSMAVADGGASADASSCAGAAGSFAMYAFVSTLGSLAAPEACGATAGIGCEAAFSAAGAGWVQTAVAYNDYLSCLGF